MSRNEYASLPDERLAEFMFMAEDRLDLAAVQEMASRPSMLPFLTEVVMDKQNWLNELPEWWAVVHGAYILGMHGGEETVIPLLATLRWADAFDCDWVSEVLPSIFGQVGPPAMAGLTTVVRDRTAGWSARDLAMRSLAAVALKNPESEQHVFRIIGERFMDEDEDRLVRQLAGQILLDFVRQEYRMALLKFAREEWAFKEMEVWYPAGFGPDEVEYTFRRGEREVWHYQEEWSRFYEPAEIQRRQKRWARERLTSSQGMKSGPPGGGGGRVLSLWNRQKGPEDSSAPHGLDPEGNE